MKTEKHRLQELSDKLVARASQESNKNANAFGLKPRRLKNFMKTYGQVLWVFSKGRRQNFPQKKPVKKCSESV